MTESITIVDNDGIIRYCNDQFIVATGYSKNELIGANANDLLLNDEDLGEMEGRLARRRTGISENYEIKLRTKSGSYVYMFISASPYRNKQGEIIGSIGVNLDITERKQAEQQLQFADSVLQNIDNCVLAADQQGELIYASPSVYRKFGFTQEQVLGKGWLELTCDKAEEIPDKKKYLSDAARGIADCSTPYETWIRDLNGNLHCMLWQDTLAPGNIVLGTGIDITHRKETEDLLKEKNKELESFIYKVSHDLRGPLTSSVGLVNLAKKQDLKGDTARYVSLIDESLGRLTQILTELTELAVIRQGELKSEAIDIEPLIEKTLLNYKDYPAYENLDVQISNELNVPMESDPSLVKVILRNLLENAVKYQKTNTKDNSVRIRIAQNGAGVKLQIADNGIGIAEDMQPRIFDVFVRATQNSKGTGMGLYIVKNAVDKLGGTIQVESMPKEGSTFTVHFPYLPANAE